jgi:hypothetical protein
MIDCWRKTKTTNQKIFRINLLLPRDQGGSVCRFSFSVSLSQNNVILSLLDLPSDLLIDSIQTRGSKSAFNVEIFSTAHARRVVSVRKSRHWVMVRTVNFSVGEFVVGQS